MATSKTQPGNDLIAAVTALMDELQKVPDANRKEIAKQVEIIRELTGLRFDQLEKQKSKWPFMPIW